MLSFPIYYSLKSVTLSLLLFSYFLGKIVPFYSAWWSWHLLPVFLLVFINESHSSFLFLIVPSLLSDFAIFDRVLLAYWSWFWFLQSWSLHHTFAISLCSWMARHCCNFSLSHHHQWERVWFQTEACSTIPMRLYHLDLGVVFWILGFGFGLIFCL